MAKLASKKGTRRFHARRKGRHKRKTNMKLMSFQACSLMGNGGFLRLFSAKIPGDEEPAQKQYFYQ